MLALLLPLLSSGVGVGATETLEMKEKRAININQVFAGGDGTFYNTYGGFGACGFALSDDVASVALPTAMFTNFPGATANPNTNPICQQSIVLSFQGVTKTFPVSDMCAGCPLEDSVDMTPAAFAAMGLDQSVGRYSGMSWHFAGASTGGGGGGGGGSPPPPSTTSTPPPPPTTTSTPPVVESPTFTRTPRTRTRSRSATSAPPELPTGSAGAGGPAAGQGGVPSGKPETTEAATGKPQPTKGAGSDSGSGSTGGSSGSTGGSTSSGDAGDHTGAYVQCDSATTWSLCDSTTGKCTSMGSVAAGTQCDGSTGRMEAIAINKRMARHTRRGH